MSSRRRRGSAARTGKRKRSNACNKTKKNKPEKELASGCISGGCDSGSGGSCDSGSGGELQPSPQSSPEQFPSPPSSSSSSSSSSSPSSSSPLSLHEYEIAPGEPSAVPSCRSKRINRAKTLQNYMDRIKAMPREAFVPLEGAYLSTYDIYSTVRSLAECSAFILANVPAVHLMEYARQKWGIRVLGVTSERRRKDGVYICPERARALVPGQSLVRSRSRSASLGYSHPPPPPPPPTPTEAETPTKVVYTGRYNYFSNTKASVWATKRSDTCYYADDDEWSDELTFIEYL